MNIFKRFSTLWFLSGLEISQFKAILEISEDVPTEPIMSIKSFAGGEIIMPSPVREAFDEGRITSIKDIL